MKTNKPISIRLIGQYEISVLDDGRIILPSDIVQRFREGDVKELYPGRIPEVKALVLCPGHIWDRWLAHLQKEYPSFQTHPGARAYTTPFKPIRWDSQRRISLPALANNYAGIKARGMAIIFGRGDYLELWAEEEFSKIKEACENALRKTEQ